MEISLSDHFLVYCVRKFRGASKKQHKIISTRQTKNCIEEDFLNDLRYVDWKKIVTSTDDINGQTCFLLFWKSMLRYETDQFLKSPPPWLTKDFKLMCKSRDWLKKLAVTSKSDLLMQV